MRAPDRRRLARVVGLIGWLVATGAAAGAELDAAELAGRRLYREGIGAGGQGVRAVVGLDASPVSGQAVPCMNCHGADGQGRAEGAVVPPPITWRELTKTYGHLHDNGRRHGVFDDAGVARAVTLGLDPAGNPLERTMPRYALGRDDLAHLVAYLKRLEDDADPGVGPTTLRVGTLLPAAGPLAEAARQMQRVLAAYLADLNAAGGLYGRRVELVVAESGGDATDTLARAQSLFTDGNVLALVGPVIVGAEASFARWADERRVPVVGPFTVVGTDAGAATRYTFFLQSGLREQVRTLVDHAVLALGIREAALTLVAADGPPYAPLEEAVRLRCERARCSRLVVHRYASGRFDAAAALQAHRDAGAGVLVFLGPDADLAALLRAADAGATHPTVLLPGAIGARAAAQAPAAFDGRLLLAYPSAWADTAAGGAFAAFRERHALGDGAIAAQASAYASAALLVEGLRRSGRAVSRDKLMAALESVRSFSPGVGPALTYGPDRRIGALGAYLVAFDASRRSFRPASPWLPLD